LLSRTVIVPPCLGWEDAIGDEDDEDDEVELGVVLPPPPLLHAAAITSTAIPRLAVPNEPSLDLMAFTYSLRLLHGYVTFTSTIIR
jgi:hypothetical protein